MSSKIEANRKNMLNISNISIANTVEENNKIEILDLL